MADGSTLSIKRTITVRAVVTPRWKEEAERELSNALSNFDAQLAQLEQEGQQVIDQIRRQSANPLDPRVQEQVGSVQQQVGAKRAELEAFYLNMTSPFKTAEKFGILDIIDPRETRSTLCDWIEDAWALVCSSKLTQ